mgnify:CR=1 FL=1
MSDLEIEIIGLIAATFTTVAFVPQVLKIRKKRDATGVSVSMYVIMFIGICIWPVSYTHLPLPTKRIV